MKEIELATMAARGYGMDHFVRLPATDYATVMRPLEAGAGGLMISMVRSPADAEQAVRWAKFWPRGERGLNGGNRDGRFGLTPLAEYTARANAETLHRRSDRDRRRTGLAQGHRRDSRRRPAVRRPVRPEPGAGRDRRLRESQMPRARSKPSPACAPTPRSRGASSAAGPSIQRGCRSWGCQLFVLGADLHVVHAGIRSLKERYAPFFTRVTDQRLLAHGRVGVHATDFATQARPAHGTGRRVARNSLLRF